MNDIFDNLSVYDLGKLFPEDCQLSQLPHWLDLHKPEIIEMISSRIDTVIQAGEEKKEISAFTLDYSSNQWKELYYSSTSIHYKPFLQMIIYCVTHYENQDCHSLVFGERKPILLPDPEKAFLELFFRSDDGIQKKIIKLLEEGNREPVNNVCYVLRERMMDIAYQKGKLLQQVISEVTTASYMRNSMLSLQNEQKKFFDKLGGKQLGATQAALLFVISAAIKYNLSLDYLILYDYSEAAIVYAADDGLHGIPELWRGVLGVYLRADVSVRRRIISQLLLQDMGFDILV